MIIGNEIFNLIGELVDQFDTQNPQFTIMVDCGIFLLFLC